MTFLTIFGVMEILSSFRLGLEGKTGKEIPESSILEFLEKFLANNFALSDSEGNKTNPMNREAVEMYHLPLFKTLLAIHPKVQRAKFLESDGLFYFSSIYKFCSCKNTFIMITSLPELYVRFRRFILLVQMKKVIFMNNSSRTSC